MEPQDHLAAAGHFPMVRGEYDLPRDKRGLAYFEEGIRLILERHGLNHASVSVLGGEGGSMPLFAVNEGLVLKLFPDILRAHYETEANALRVLNGKTTCRVPQVKHHGSLDGWHYVIMTRVGGVQLSSIWKKIDDRVKEVLCERLGSAVAELHRVGTPSAADSAAWRAFIDQQARGCVERQRHHGLREELLAQIPDFIRPVMPSIKAAPGVFLHTELMLEHVFVDPDRLTIEGLIDFEPSMRGAAEYDFGAVAIFIAQAQPTLLKAFLQGYGYEWNKAGVPSARVLMTYTLLHRYSRLTWYLDRLEGERGREVVELVELERRWYRLDEPVTA